MKWSCLLKDFGVSIPTLRRYVFISPGYPRPSQQYSCGMLSVQTAGKLDAGCRMQVFCISSSALAKRMQHGQGTSHLPSLPPLCGRFSPHHHHHIIYLCPFF